jgi:hypothetical protein
MKKKIYSFSIGAIVPNATQGALRFLNGQYYIVISEVEKFHDFSADSGQIDFKSGQNLRVKNPEFKDFVAFMIS